MKEMIVVTDGYTLNPGDLSWRGIESLGEVTLYDRTKKEEVSERCRHATVIVTNKTPVSAETIRVAKKLKLIAVTATGYNIVDIVEAKKSGVIVCNVPGYGTDSVAQHTFALLLELTNHVGINSQSVKDGGWSRSEDFCFSEKPLQELSGKTFGIIGYGKIGRKVGEIAKAFGMNLIFNSPSLEGKNPQAVAIENIFSNSDVVSLHCPLTRDNAGFVNRSLLTRMKPTAFLINTSRGQLINEGDLAEALSARNLAGAALDVLSEEPPPADHPLVGLRNCIITPHNAWCSLEARKRIMDITTQNIAAALHGSPEHVVNS